MGKSTKRPTGYRILGDFFADCQKLDLKAFSKEHGNAFFLHHGPIGKLKEPVIMPNEYEREGYVPNVAYTCGAIIHNDVLVVPYGVSDTSTCVTTIKLRTLLDKLVRQ